MQILLIDDDTDFLELLGEYLSDSGIKVYTASSGHEAFHILERESFHLILLDIMMPEMDGLELLKRINGEYPLVPVVFLTARGEEIDRILGLELGADDYIVKTCSPRELLARIKAIKRRTAKLTEEVKENDSSINIDLKKREVTVRGERVELTAIGFEILNIFLQNKGIVLSREVIMDLVRGKEFLAYDRSIDVNISRLRQKIELNPENPLIIKTVRGVGYVFTG